MNNPFSPSRDGPGLPASSGITDLALRSSQSSVETAKRGETHQNLPRANSTTCRAALPPCLPVGLNLTLSSCLLLGPCSRASQAPDPSGTAPKYFLIPLISCPTIPLLISSGPQQVPGALSCVTTIQFSQGSRAVLLTSTPDLLPPCLNPSSGPQDKDQGPACLPLAPSPLLPPSPLFLSSAPAPATFLSSNTTQVLRSCVVTTNCVWSLASHVGVLGVQPGRGAGGFSGNLWVGCGQRKPRRG